MGLVIFHTTTGAWDARFHSHSTIVRPCAVPVDGLGTTDFARAKTLAPSPTPARLPALLYVWCGCPGDQV